jgi:uncharacterized protein with PIN domain
MANCPACGTEIDRVDAEMIDLNPSDAVEATGEEPSRAIATVCPACEAIIGI